MNYYLFPSAITLAFFLLTLWLIWRWYMESYDWKKDFPALVRGWRLGNKLSQAQAAEILSRILEEANAKTKRRFRYDAKTISDWERGRHAPSHMHYQQMKHVFDDKVKWVVGELTDTSTPAMLVMASNPTDEEFNFFLEQCRERQRLLRVHSKRKR